MPTVTGASVMVPVELIAAVMFMSSATSVTFGAVSMPATESVSVGPIWIVSVLPTATPPAPMVTLPASEMSVTLPLAAFVAEIPAPTPPVVSAPFERSDTAPLFDVTVPPSVSVPVTERSEIPPFEDSAALVERLPVVFVMSIPPFAVTGPMARPAGALSLNAKLPAPSVTGPRFATTLVTVFSVAVPPLVTTTRVPAVITPVAFCVIALPAPVVVSDTAAAPAFTVLLMASAPPAFRITPPVAPTAPVTVSPPAFRRFSEPVPSVAPPRFVTAFVAVFSVAPAFAVPSVSVFAVITPVAFCVIALPAPVVVRDTFPPPAFRVLLIASAPPAFRVTPPVAPTGTVTVSPPAFRRFSAPAPSAAVPRFATEFVAVFSVASAPAVARFSVAAVITPVAACVIVFAAPPVVASETVPPPAFRAAFTVMAPAFVKSRFAPAKLPERFSAPVCAMKAVPAVMLSTIDETVVFIRTAPDPILNPPFSVSGKAPLTDEAAPNAIGPLAALNVCAAWSTTGRLIVWMLAELFVMPLFRPTVSPPTFVLMTNAPAPALNVIESIVVSGSRS